MAEIKSVLSIDRIKGARIYDPVSVLLGKIDGLLIDMSSGRVKYVMIDTLDPQEDSRPLPWEKVFYNPAMARFYSYVTSAQLHEAPPFDETMQTAEWDRRLRVHYNLQCSD